MKSYRKADLATIFSGTEKSLFSYSSLKKKELNEKLNLFKNIKKETRTDKDYFLNMVKVTFYSGFKAKTVDGKIPAIEKLFSNIDKVAKYDKLKVQNIIDSKIVIGNRLKINGIIHNAKEIKSIQKKFGSFDNYINSFGDERNENVLDELVKDLKKRFKYLGGITVFHFLTDLGFNVLKPDRVLSRIFYRIGLIDREDDYWGVIRAGRRISLATKLPIRYIDIIFVLYGQVGEKKDFGILDGICLSNNPKCELCGIYNYCQFKAEKEN